MEHDFVRHTITKLHVWKDGDSTVLVPEEGDDESVDGCQRCDMPIEQALKEPCPGNRVPQ
jgi:hypothetical protein